MTVVTHLLDPATGTPPCGPPVLDPATGWTVTRHADVRAALLDPACHVPVARPGPPGTLAWLRGTVSRFSPPATHPTRRAAGAAMLAALDPDELREAAARRTGEALDRAGDRLDVMAVLARRVPLRVLAARLGLADLDAAVPAVTTVAAAYHPGADPATVRRADRAVAALLELTPPDPPEVRANRIGLLVQAGDATAGLIGAATRHVLAWPADVPTGALLAEVLRLDPPVRGTRRVTTGPVRLGGRDLAPGSAVLLRFDAANRDPAVFAEPDRLLPGRPGAALTFGTGPRGCPGERHALALATGVVDVLRRRCRPVPAPVRHEPHALLRVPTRLEVCPR
ncbi:cytochrome P450 [Micromonospora sp. C28SCA-DRY-2]|uniref:cytochrome P450 n=1 Tax=Micromonospora sp. C28SCA-DRY-2 TaxID=3059522 RepID=UPI0026766B9D|nr:cytochrome P450 [Micromonospora sp. C28SCA-DRY-2]MDO3705349.1 cytochrome P450 [Micromonospora sp. C28SCA-DRY-2]